MAVNLFVVAQIRFLLICRYNIPMKAI